MVECSLFDGYAIPYEDNKFDIAIISHVVEQVEYPRVLLYEAARVAKYVYFEVPLEDIARLPEDFKFDKVGHINFYSPRTFRWLIQSSNLKVLNQITFNSPKGENTFQKGWKGLVNYYIKELLLKIFPRLATSLFANNGAIVCEKKE
jgi:ubiquinone/menaquinone biosynthesis C-methylase UbiE